MNGRIVGLAAGALAAGWFAAVQAQAPAGSSTDIMPALLAEVRGLRAVMEQMASAGARIQLTLGRLQLQEQRLNVANVRLQETRNDLTNTQRRQTELQEQVANLEASLSGQREMDLVPGAPPEQQRAIMKMQLGQNQRELASVGSEIQRLIATAAAAESDVANEQARWSDLNQRLDDLERALHPLK